MGLNEERNLEPPAPFEAEMRRRLWSQIHLVNGCPARRGGNGHPVTTAPSNCNDSDLFPSMAKLPDDHGRGTEMVFCELHRDVGDCLARLKSGAHGEHRDPASQLEILVDFESKLEQITRKCDTSAPLHLFTVLAGRSVATQLRFSVHAGAHFSEDPETDRSILDPRVFLLESAIDIIECDAELRSNQTLQPFLWHPVVQFPFDAFVFVLRELRDGLGGEERSAAWVAVNRVYEDHPEFVTRGGVPLYAAVGDLAVRAWDVAVKAGAAGEMGPGGFEGLVESHALARLREERALRRVGLSGGDECGESGAKGEEGELGWGAWQQMLHDAGYWQGFASRA
ncbi:fungal specific transcription factor domain-containing protein [Candidatus Bathyarchaeota archaeon]|nr:fungal specific transcription factor domain-containing protein [Candidatus Bathyarchaeota archaeon]